MGIIDSIKGVFKRLINKNNIQQQLGIDIDLSSDMRSAIALWSDIYSNNAPWKSETVQSMNLGSSISSELARMITLEFTSNITGSERADYLNEQYASFISKIREFVEYGCAKGGIAFKPYPENTKICVDVVQADKFFPVSHDSGGNITGAVFVEQLTKGKEYYTRFEYHQLEEQKYYVTNKAYVSDGRSRLGREIDLESVPEWASITPSVQIDNVLRPLFGYYKFAQANIVDGESPLGESCFSRAIEIMEEADKQYSRFLWEFEGGELALDVDATLFEKDKEGKPIIPKGKKRLYRTYQALDYSDSGKENLKTFSPALRDESLKNGLNVLLMKIEDICCISRGTLSDVSESTVKTATELKIQKQRTYANVKDNQRSLQNALDSLVYAMDVYATLYDLAPSGEYKVSYGWDDSVIVDADAMRNIRLQEVAAGIISAETYLMETRGITEEDARKIMPKMQQIV